MSQILEVKFLKTSDLKPNPRQPRLSFDKEKLEELAQSIRETGLVQPVIVRKSGQGYEIIAGERRWRSCKIAKLEKIPAIIKGVTDNRMLIESFIENLHREDLTSTERENAVYELWTQTKDGSHMNRPLDENKGGGDKKSEAYRFGKSPVSNSQVIWEFESTVALAKALGFDHAWVRALIEAKQFRERIDAGSFDTEPPTTLLQVTQGLDDKTRVKVIQQALNGESKRSSQSELRATVKVLKQAPASIKNAFQKGEISLEDATYAVERYEALQNKGVEIDEKKINTHTEELKRRRKHKNAQAELEQELDDEILKGEKESSSILVQDAGSDFLRELQEITAKLRSYDIATMMQVGEKNWSEAKKYFRTIREQAEKLLGQGLD